MTTLRAWYSLLSKKKEKSDYYSLNKQVGTEMVMVKKKKIFFFFFFTKWIRYKNIVYIYITINVGNKGSDR